MPDQCCGDPKLPPSGGTPDVSSATGVLPVAHGGTGADLSNSAAAKVLATPPGATGPVTLRSLAAEHLPAISPNPAGTYTFATVEIDAHGRVISASSSGAPSAHAASHKAGGSDALLAAPGEIGGGTPAAITGTTITATGGFVGDGSGLTGLPSGGGDSVTTLADGSTITTGGRYYLPPGAACTVDIADGVYVWLAVGGSGILIPNTAGPWRVLGGGDAGTSLFVASPALIQAWRVSNRMMHVAF